MTEPREMKTKEDENEQQNEKEHEKEQGDTMEEYFAIQNQQSDQPIGPRESRPKKRKLSIGSKLLLAGGAIAGAGYMMGKKVWKYFYPPSFKRYFAVLALSLTMLGVKNCNAINNELKNFYNGTRKTIELRVSRETQVKSLETRLEESMTDNKYYIRIIDQKDQALKEAREYITDTEKKYFNTKNFRKKGPFGMIKDNPPDEAFQHYLLHNKGYNKIINKIDENLGKDR